MLLLLFAQESGRSCGGVFVFFFVSVFDLVRDCSLSRGVFGMAQEKRKWGNLEFVEAEAVEKARGFGLCYYYTNTTSASILF